MPLIIYKCIFCFIYPIVYGVVLRVRGLQTDGRTAAAVHEREGGPAATATAEGREELPTKRIPCRYIILLYRRKVTSVRTQPVGRYILLYIPTSRGRFINQGKRWYIDPVGRCCSPIADGKAVAEEKGRD